MNNKSAWINRRVQLGAALLVISVLVGVTGLLLQRPASDLAFDPRLITGLAILIFGLGISNLVRYGLAGRDPLAARRLAQEERDERLQLIRARAGNKAYLVSAVMTYGLLMWISFASNGSLPDLSADALWYALAAIAVVPAFICLASILIDQSRM